MLKVATVCTGIGSPEKAIENLGIPHEIVFGCEIDKYARQTYLANFTPGFMLPDMTKCDWEGEQYYSDLFIGGIPCQAFSLAGKRLGELDPRGLLFYDFYRYVKNQRPKYFIIENVKGLLSMNDGEVFQNWINLLGKSVNGDEFIFPHEDSLMYNLHWQVLNTKDYGIPQNRERVFLVGIRNDLPNSFVFPKGVPLKLRLKDVLEDEVDEKYYLSEKMLKGLKVSDEIKNDNLISIIGHSGTGGQKGDIYDISGISGCLSATDYKQPKQIKVQSATAAGYEIATEIQVIGNYHKSGQNASRIVSGNGIAPTVKENHGTVTAVVEKNDYSEMILKSINSDISTALDASYYKGFGVRNGVCRQVVSTDYRIRKLTTKECFRLQGFPDEFHDKAVAAGVSNSQLYKQAGNSITVNVIQAILKNLLTDYV